MDSYFDRKIKKKCTGTKYSNNFGDMYPGMQIGHKNCAIFKSGLPVPAHMGWLWNAPSGVRGLKDRRGWQPGAVGKTLMKMMKFKLKGLEKDVKDKKKKTRSGRREHGGEDSEQEEPLAQKPMLRVQRKGDIYTIQINPLKDLSKITHNEDPYIECDPIIFKIIKKRTPEEFAKMEARKMARMKKQRDAKIRKALAEATEDICKCAYMDVYCNDLKALDKTIEACPAFNFEEPECICREDSSSSLSSNATWDIEYTPPFGRLNFGTDRRKTFIHVNTQYISTDAGLADSEKYKNKKAQTTPKTKKQRK